MQQKTVRYYINVQYAPMIYHITGIVYLQTYLIRVEVSHYKYNKLSILNIWFMLYKKGLEDVAL